MRLLYNILFALGFIASSPFYFVKMWRRGNWRRGFRERFGKFGGRVKMAVTNADVLWLHAVSVGEVGLCVRLVEALEPRVPNMKIVVSTTTTTGMGELEKRLPNHITKIYYPVDFPSAVSRALLTLHPAGIVLVEAEIWPNFLWQAVAKKIPVFLANARLSDRSFPRYRRAGFLFRPLFASFTGIGCPSAVDAERLLAVGARPGAVRVVGNMKYDTARAPLRRAFDASVLFRQIGVPRDALLLVAGSTHDGEEALLAGIFLKLRAKFPALFLVLVPRHQERGRAVARELEQAGVKFALRGDVIASSAFAPGSLQCLVVNTTGELRSFYERADVVFVGKSLTATGGQNPIEPAALGKPVVFGPHMENFAVVSEELIQRRAAVRVPDAAALESALAELLADERRRRELGENALAVVEENAGAVERTADMIVEHFEQQGTTYVARPTTE